MCVDSTYNRGTNCLYIEIGRKSSWCVIITRRLQAITVEAGVLLSLRVVEGPF